VLSRPRISWPNGEAGCSANVAFRGSQPRFTARELSPEALRQESAVGHDGRPSDSHLVDMSEGDDDGY
jgi:hypothetical protein